MNAWIGNEALIAAWTSTGTGRTLVELIAEDGRIMQQQEVASSAGRVSLPIQGLSNGTYLVRIASGSDTRVFRVPVMR